MWAHLPLVGPDFPQPPPSEGEPPSGLPRPWPACLGESEVGAWAERERGEEVALPRGQGRQRPGRVHDHAGAPLTTSALQERLWPFGRTLAEMVLAWLPLLGTCFPGHWVSQGHVL